MTLLQLKAYRIKFAHAFAFEVLILLTTTLAASGHRSIVVDFKGDMKGLIQGFKIIEHLALQLGVDVLIDQLYSIFYKSFILRLTNSGWHYGATMMLSKRGKVLVQFRLVFTRTLHC